VPGSEEIVVRRRGKLPVNWALVIRILFWTIFLSIIVALLCYFLAAIYMLKPEN
jgi:hypothetical protein